ncbi:uncharacterized protein LOC142931276 [Petromyzon marinus]|uniref:uncharacterized protein LOC142931276 n=1 Tax=Petromyzon marinus TaxID=7757 RepID=UPI003F724F3A
MAAGGESQVCGGGVQGAHGARAPFTRRQRERRPSISSDEQHPAKAACLLSAAVRYVREPAGLASPPPPPPPTTTTTTFSRALLLRGFKAPGGPLCGLVRSLAPWSMAVSRGDVVYQKGQSDDSDIWDGTALIKAYDKAVTSFKTALKNGTATCESPKTCGETKSVNKRAKTRRRHKRSSVSPSDKVNILKQKITGALDVAVTFICKCDL